MIVYALVCSDGHHFDAWFRDSDSFDGQRQSGALHCPICGGHSIYKAPMAPHVARGDRETQSLKAERPLAAANPMAETVVRMVAALRQHIEATCEDVGSRFPEEARRIHYGESAAHGIYGEATPPEAAELREEGIAIAAIPWFIRRNG